TPDFSNRNYVSHFSRLSGARIRRVLLRGQMRPRVEVVTEVSFQDPSQMPLPQHDDVIEAFSANTPNQPLREWILPRTSRRGEDLRDSHPVNSVSKMITVNAISIPYQVLRCRIVRESFDELLRRPFCSRVLRHIEMHYTPSLMPKDDEDKQSSQL